ncbi:acyl-CoA dehydrogenase family protein [Slackia heliotrinireducens]|uniref:acyl-CoA dehydrogenase family protein n=1 Tax=Slackia heliotrinireducens TaxID=84110 RepID=UPI003314F1DD
MLPPATALSGLNGTIWITYAANFLGMTERVYEMAKEYVMQRTRMDKPLGTFQAVAHAVANAKVNIEAMRGLILNAIDNVTTGNANSVLCFGAKVYCRQTAMKTIESLLELWGGVGVTEEACVARYMRDAIAAGPGEYPTFALLDIIAQKEGLPVETQLDFVHWTDVAYEGYNQPEE